MNKYSDLEFLSLADRISRDYKVLLTHVLDNNIDLSNVTDLTAFRILIECHQSEDIMSVNDVEQLMRLDEVSFSQALIKLIGLEYVYTEGTRLKGRGRLVHLTPEGVLLAQKYETMMDDIVESNETMSALFLTDVERSNIIMSLISLQNRTRALLRKVSL